MYRNSLKLKCQVLECLKNPSGIGIVSARNFNTGSRRIPNWKNKRHEIVRFMGGHGHDRPSHMDDMPVPRGSWKAHYNAQQKKYNLHLFVGVTFFIATLVAFRIHPKVFLNWSIPPLPEDECPPPDRIPKC